MNLSVQARSDAAAGWLSGFFVLLAPAIGTTLVAIAVVWALMTAFAQPATQVEGPRFDATSFRIAERGELSPFDVTRFRIIEHTEAGVTNALDPALAIRLAEHQGR